MDNQKQFKVLIVEDEFDARELYVEILGVNGFDVIGAEDGDKALKALSLGQYDLVLLDIVMPIKDGVQTLAELKEDPVKFGTPKVIMLSNIGGDLAIDKAMELGADGYILKSEVEPEELVKVITKYLEGK